jgi:cell division protein WhiA
VARLAVRLERGTRVAFSWDRAASHCRMAYLRGLFLARGSLSLAGGRQHLEFVVPAADAEILATRLTALDMPASWRLRRSLGVVTWKRTETIVRFLQAAGASGAVLELESRLVARALRGQLNRALNAETGNLGRAAMAAARQTAAIERLAAADQLMVQPPRVRAVARARMAAPEASLAELAVEAGLSRPTVQRALERLVTLGEASDGPPGRPRDGTPVALP